MDRDDDQTSFRARMGTRVAARVPAAFALFAVMAILSAATEWITFPARRSMILAVDAGLIVMIAGALAVVRARPAWSIAVMVVCTNLVAVTLTGYHAANGALAEGCLLMLAGLLFTVVVLFPWGSRAQAAASLGAVITYPMALWAGAQPALAPAAGMIFLAVLVAMAMAAADLIERYHHRIDELHLARKQVGATRQELSSSESQLRQILDLVPHMVFAKDSHGTLLLVNQAVADAYGSTVEALTGASHADLHADPGELAAMLADDREVITSGRAKFIPEETFVDATGTRRVLQTIKIPYVRPGGSGGAVLGVAVDITELKRAEEGRRKLEVQVLEAQKLESLGVLAGGIAHDFNNLLVGILGNASLALDTIDSDAECRRFVLEVEKAGQRASELCKQMLTYSGRGRASIERFALADVVREIVGLLTSSISKKATLNVDWGEALPDVAGDMTQIRQVVMNLVTNASDALGNEAGTITIRTRALDVYRSDFARMVVSDGLRDGTYVCIEISDTGCGMSPTTVARIFDPFFTTKFAGRGLGLSAVLGIVRGHGGTVDVESTPGEGTTIRILLPAQERPAASPTEVRFQAPARDSEHGRVLVVDDEEMVRAVTKEALELRGFDVVVAEDGQQALDLLEDDGAAVELVILDMTMPRLDGEETLQGLRRIAPTIPVLLVSGYTKEDAASHLREQNVVGFLQKPFRIRELLTRVQTAVRTSREAQ